MEKSRPFTKWLIVVLVILVVLAGCIWWLEQYLVKIKGSETNSREYIFGMKNSGVAKLIEIRHQKALQDCGFTSLPFQETSYRDDFLIYWRYCHSYEACMIVKVDPGLLNCEVGMQVIDDSFADPCALLEERPDLEKYAPQGICHPSMVNLKVEPKDDQYLIITFPEWRN